MVKLSIVDFLENKRNEELNLIEQKSIDFRMDAIHASEEFKLYEELSEKLSKLDIKIAAMDIAHCVPFSKSLADKLERIDEERSKRIDEVDNKYVEISALLSACNSYTDVKDLLSQYNLIKNNRGNKNVAQ